MEAWFSTGLVVYSFYAACNPVLPTNGRRQSSGVGGELPEAR